MTNVSVNIVIILITVVFLFSIVYGVFQICDQPPDDMSQQHHWTEPVILFFIVSAFIIMAFYSFFTGEDYEGVNKK